MGNGPLPDDPPSWRISEKHDDRSGRDLRRVVRASGRDGAGHTAALRPGGRDPRTARPTVGPRRATPPPQPHPRTCPRKPPTPPRVAPVAGTGRARLGWGPTSGYAALAADRTGATGRAAGGRGSRLTDHRHGGASASHAGRGHRVSRPPTHRPRRETDPCGRARERGPRRAGPVADGAATAKETPASPLLSACS